MTTFCIEMKHGQDMRRVEADSFNSNELGWMIFYRKPPQGGTKEYWRVRLESVVSMETVPWPTPANTAMLQPGFE